MPNTLDFRALAQELLQHARVAQNVLIGEGLWDDDDQDEGLFDRAEKALATPPPEAPTDEERLALQGKLWGKYKTIPYQGEEFMYGDAFESALSDYRAALARWGRPATPPPEPPVDGEVPELAALIRQCALAWEPDARLLGNMTAAQLARAAELLERTATPPPEAPTAGEVVELVRWLRTISKHYRIDRAATLLEQLSAPAPVGVPMVLTKPQLEKLNEVLHSHQDEGPPYPEGWASPELEDLRQIIDRWSTAPAPAVVPVGDATTPPRPQPTGGRQIGPFF